MMRRPQGSAQLRDVGDAAERARIRESQHATLADLLGAYADGELPAESAARVEAHLVGCTRCRRDLATQTALRDRLAAEMVVPASPAFRDRIFAATAAAPPPVLAPPVAEPVVPAPAPGSMVGRPAWRVLVTVIGGLAIAVGLGGAALSWGRATPRDMAPAAVSLASPASSVPLFAAALADYRRATGGDLPGRARDLDAVRATVGFAVEPLRTPELRLLAAWTTMLGGEPSAVLAYRRGDRLVLEYRVPESVYFRHAALRDAAAAHRPLAAVDGAQGVLAWPEATTGVLLVSDDAPRHLLGSLSALLFATPPTGSVLARPGTAP